MMKPEPRELTFCARCSCGICCWNCLKNSSNGEPGGKLNGMPFGPWFWTTCVDETLTTAGETLAARSAKLLGAPAIKPGAVACGVVSAGLMVGQAVTAPMLSTAATAAPASSRTRVLFFGWFDCM